MIDLPDNFDVLGANAKDVTIIVLVMAGTVILTKLLSGYLKKNLSDRLKEEQIGYITKVLNLAIYIIVFTTLLSFLGLDLSSILVAWGFTGIIIGFASQSVISNLISGIFLMAERPIKIGDTVTVDDTTGTVVDIHVMSTVMRTYDGLYIRIPNDKVFTSKITNLSINYARRFEYEIGIRYTDDADRAVEIISDVIDEHPLTLVNPAPLVFVNELGDNAVVIVAKVWAPSAHWYGVKTELLWVIKHTLEQHGINVPFPQRTIWFGNELKTITKKE
jgi:small-conductance mechanosensitive channel